MNFNFEPLCCKNSSATLLLSKNYVIMAENDVKCLDQYQALEFLQHRGSKLKFINLERNN